jgi:hypothetical protein
MWNGRGPAAGSACARRGRCQRTGRTTAMNRDSTTWLSALRAGNRLMSSIGTSCCPCAPRCSTRRGSGRNTAKAIRCRYIAGAGAIAVNGAMTIRTRLRRTDRHRGDTGVAAGQAADLEAAAPALSSLSFGLAYVDQLVFGADCELLKRITRRAGVRQWPRAAAGATGRARPLGLSEAGSPESRVMRAESAAIYRGAAVERILVRCGRRLGLRRSLDGNDG